MAFSSSNVVRIRVFNDDGENPKSPNWLLRSALIAFRCMVSYRGMTGRRPGTGRWRTAAHPARRASPIRTFAFLSGGESVCLARFTPRRNPDGSGAT
ncbi:hypothetical protein STAL104432_04980 [Streptomyces albus]